MAKSRYVRRRGIRRPTGWRKYAMSAVNTGIALYNRYGGGYKAKTSSGGGVTSQYDKMTVYRKKRMPRRKRRAWGKFVKKVRAALMKEVGTKTIVRNNALTGLWTADTQKAFSVTVYGSDGSLPSTTECGQDDLKSIFNNDGELFQETSKAKFGSAVVDITMANASTVVGGPGNSGLEIDIYDIVYRKEIDAPTLLTLLSSANTNTTLINGSGTGLSLALRGVTPFDLPDASSRGMKILKKKKYFLGSGEVATYQLRDARNRTFRRDVIDNSDDNYILPGSTRTLLIIAKGVPTGDPSIVNKLLNIGCTRKYMYKTIQANYDADQYL